MSQPAPSMRKWYKRTIVGGLLIGAAQFAGVIWLPQYVHWLTLLIWPVILHIAVAVVAVIDYGNHLKAGGSFQDQVHRVDGSPFMDEDPELAPYFMALKYGSAAMYAGAASGKGGSPSFQGGGGSFGGGGGSGGW